MTILDNVRSARRVSVPILAINTPDQVATIATLVEGINGETAKVQWDFVRGFRPLNDEGASELAGLGDEAEDAIANPAGAVRAALGFSEGTLVFVLNSHRFLDDVGFTQAVCNVRDAFKANHRTLVLLAPNVDLPPELAGDVVVLDEPLPDSEQITRIIKEVYDSTADPDEDRPALEISDETLEQAVAATTGLPAFQVEQITAMSLTPDGVVMDDLWEHSLHTINQTKGLTAYMGGEGFDAIGGCQAIKDRSYRVVNGRRKPNAVVWLDEGEKAFAGAGTDVNGIADDALGTLLTEMEETKAMGFIFLGHAGTAKSATSKAIGGEAGIPTIRFDLGAMQGSLVGESQQAIRTACRVVKSVSNGNALWVMTCNDISKLPPALLRRFRKGIYFFDLPTDEERDTIWELYLAKYGVETDMDVSEFDDGWTGAEIEQCVTTAYEENVPVSLARHAVVPQCVVSAEGVEQLRKFANRRILSASSPGFYVMPTKDEGGRKINLAS